MNMDKLITFDLTAVSFTGDSFISSKESDSIFVANTFTINNIMINPGVKFIAVSLFGNPKSTEMNLLK
jgi:hypothetical protein